MLEGKGKVKEECIECGANIGPILLVTVLS